jgi:large subunit ribosomal protein L22
MIAHAQGRFLREAPMKVRQVIDLIRGKDVVSSMAILTHVNKGSTVTVKKILQSAVSNAKQKGLSEDQLYISKIVAESGPDVEKIPRRRFWPGHTDSEKNGPY